MRNAAAVKSTHTSTPAVSSNVGPPSPVLTTANNSVNNNNQQDTAKLIFGIIYSLRSMVRKINNEDAFVSYKTSKYRLHYFETPTNLKFVLITDPKVDNLKVVLHQIYVSLYVEFVVKNPLSIEYTRGQTLNNELFVLGLDAFISSLPGFN
jgi:hypothetical protein